jgi:polygalacturonase
MSIGSETAGGVRNVLVRNCTFENTENGLRIKSQRGRGGLVENITYTNITMRDVNPAITLTCYYMYNSAGDPIQPGQNAQPQTKAPRSTNSIPLYRHIRIQNLNATCTKSAGTILGLPESPIEDVLLENVHISAATGLTVHDAKGLKFTDSGIGTKQGPPVAAEHAQIEGIEVQNAPSKRR